MRFSDVSVGSGTLDTLKDVFVAAADLEHDLWHAPDLIVVDGLRKT